jgi:hypothetical protein
MHFFATADHSITDPSHLAVVYNELQHRFPKAEGFDLNVWYYEDKSLSVQMPTFLEKYQDSIRKMENEVLDCIRDSEAEALINELPHIPSDKR